MKIFFSDHSSVNPIRIFSAVVLILIISLHGVNFLNQMVRAEQKPLWSDESYSLKHTIQANSYVGLLLKECRKSEANTTPLDYLFVKVFDDVRERVNGFGLSDEIYYRLWANFVIAFCGIFIASLFVYDINRSQDKDWIRLIQLLLLLLLPFAYLFRPLVYHYTAEVRPYALWFALWFIAVGSCLRRDTRKTTIAFWMILIAMTMVGSLFNIFALGLAYFIVMGMEKGWKRSLLDSLKIFLIPTLVVFYFSFPAAYGDRAIDTFAVAWGKFWKLWTHEATIIPLMLGCIGLMFYHKEDRRLIVAPLAVLIFFLIGPGIFVLTKARGYFFTNRQYICYDLHRAVFLLCVIKFLPAYLRTIDLKIKPRSKLIPLGLAIVLTFVSIRLVLAKKNIRRFNEAVQNASGFLDHQGVQ